MVATTHLEADGRFLRPEVLAAGYHSFVSVPLLLPHGVIGVFCAALTSSDEAKFKKLCQELDHIAPLLAACLHSCLESLSERLRGELSQQPTWNAATQGLLEEMMHFSPALAATLREYKPEQPAATDAQGCRGFAQCPSLAGIPSISKSPLLACPHQAAGSTLCLPLYQRGQVMGVSMLQFSASAPEKGSQISTEAAVPLLWLTRQALDGLERSEDSTQTPPWLEIIMLGRFRVRRNGEWLEPKDFKRRQAYLLLKILASRFGRAVSTDELCEALWPQDVSERALPRLHVTLNALRRVLEPDPQRQQVIIRDGQTYAFAPSLPYRLDVVEFEGLVQRADRAVGAGALQMYQQALELYHGDLLEDELYAAWTVPERAYYRELAVHSLQRMAKLQADLNLDDELVITYTRLLSLDPYCFEAYEELLACLEHTGRGAEAELWRERFEQALTIGG